MNNWRSRQSTCAEVSSIFKGFSEAFYGIDSSDFIGNVVIVKMFQQ